MFLPMADKLNLGAEALQVVGSTVVPEGFLELVVQMRFKHEVSLKKSKEALCLEFLAVDPDLRMMAVLSAS